MKVAMSSSLYQQRLFTGSVPRRKEIRIDDWEMRPDVQEKS
jgi:trans-2-enoyl-CoA reductase